VRAAERREYERLHAELRIEVLKLVRSEIAAAVHQLRAEVAACDRERINAQLLLAIYRHAKGRTFSVRELLDFARMMHPLAFAVAAAVDPSNARKVGRLLAKLEDADLNGLRLVRDGQDRDGTLWHVEPTASLTTQTRVGPCAGVAIRAA
jgi:hypothetical protein